MNRKTLTFALAATGLTVGGLGMAQVASAQSDDTGTGTEVEADTGQDTGTAEDRPGQDGRRGRGCHRGEHGEIVAGVLGIEPDELRAALAEGQSLAAVAEANGVDPQDVVDALVAEVEAKLDAAVEAGDLTADEAADRLEERAERIEDRIDEVRPEGDEARRPGRGHPRSQRPGAAQATGTGLSA